MNDDRTPCASPDALVGYLYDECEPAERESIASHIALCPLFADEVRALSDTRAHLGAWSPPALPLGFQLSRAESDQPADQATGKVLGFAGRASRKSMNGGWWRQPLPAWAQAAAAVVIFAAGMSVSALRSPDHVPQAASVRQPAAVVATPVAASTVSRDDLARLEARLSGLEDAQTHRAAVQVPRTASSIDAAMLVERVNAIEEKLTQSERLNLKRFAAIAEAVNRTHQEVNQRASVMEEGQQELERAIRYTLNPSSLAVRTSLQTNGR